MNSIARRIQRDTHGIPATTEEQMEWDYFHSYMDSYPSMAERIESTRFMVWDWLEGQTKRKSWRRKQAQCKK